MRTSPTFQLSDFPISRLVNLPTLGLQLNSRTSQLPNSPTSPTPTCQLEDLST
ncbi:hypothetical protein [Limnospira fusiformis]|uniref:hypothetical protein n=1 Tax=Limnospira fusiformis TaxID=54297 RepID=UPI001448B274|nr:hypothetical protein HFV01_14270 [Limnospira fusiformis SAG 85.79]